MSKEPKQTPQSAAAGMVAAVGTALASALFLLAAARSLAVDRADPSEQSLRLLAAVFLAVAAVLFAFGSVRRPKQGGTTG